MDNKFIKKLDNASTDYYKTSVLISIIERKDANSILKEIFPLLSHKDYFDVLATSLFRFFLSYKMQFRDEILYLMKRDNINWRELGVQDIENIISIDGGIEELVINFEKINIRSQKIVSEITRFVMSNRQDILGSLIDKVINIKESNTVHFFFVELLTNDINFDYNLILESLRKCKKAEDDRSFSDLPYTLIEYMYWNNCLLDFLVSNFEELFSYEKEKKIRFFEKMKKHLDEKITRKYNYLLNICNACIDEDFCEKALNILLDYQEEDFIIDYVGSEKVQHLGIGTTAEALKIGTDKVLKIIAKKHEKNSEKEHFLLAPTKQKVVIDEYGNPILYVEKQDFLLQTHDGIEMNNDDLNNFFNELEKCEMELNDPHCLAREFKNFGFLRDYHDATLVGVNSYDELPEWFKKRPVVLLDIDMITKLDKKEKRKLVV